MKWRLYSLAAFALISVAQYAPAQEADIRKNIEDLIGNGETQSITKSGFGNLYEVVLRSGEIVYADEKGGYFIAGQLIDVKNKKNITQARMAQLSKIDFGELPLDQAIKQVKGNGKRVVATFEDPNCGYCKKLAKELKGLKDATIYTFMIPILAPDSLVKSKNIWCAADKAKAWNDWMQEGKAPAVAKCDASVIEKNAAMGRKLRVNGTPTLFLADGSRLGGYVTLDELDQAMNEAEARKAK